MATVTSEKPRRGAPPMEKDPVAIEKFCNLVAEGVAARDACGQCGFSQPTLWKWIAQDEEFAKQYAHAKELCAHLFADETRPISEEKNDGTMEPSEFNARQRLRFDQRKWHASKLAPKIYGDKVAIGGADDLPPIKTINREMSPQEAYALMLVGQAKLGDAAPDDGSELV